TPTRVGQVLQVGTVAAGPRYYLVRADGLVGITQTEAGLVLGNPANAAAYGGGAGQPRATSAYAGSKAARSAVPPATGCPDRTPRPVQPPAPGTALCAEGDGLHDTVLFTAPALPVPAGAAVSQVADAGGRTADQVYVPPGSGALVAATQSPGAPAGTTYLITDTGRRYPVPTPDAVSALGYRAADRVGVGSTVLALLPTGVPLD